MKGYENSASDVFYIKYDNSLASEPNGFFKMIKKILLLKNQGNNDGSWSW